MMTRFFLKKFGEKSTLENFEKKNGQNCVDGHPRIYINLLYHKSIENNLKYDKSSV